MSEDDRSRLYAWLREQTDEPLAEYLMSCLAPAPLSDLVTKEHLSAVLVAELSRFAAKEEMQAGFDKLAAQREADRAHAAQQREADRAHAAQQRKADRRWVTAAAVFIAVEVAAVEAGWLSRLTDLFT